MWNLRTHFHFWGFAEDNRDIFDVYSICFDVESRHNSNISTFCHLLIAQYYFFELMQWNVTTQKCELWTLSCIKRILLFAFFSVARHIKQPRQAAAEEQSKNYSINKDVRHLHLVIISNLSIVIMKKMKSLVVNLTFWLMAYCSRFSLIAFARLEGVGITTGKRALDLERSWAQCDDGRIHF